MCVLTIDSFTLHGITCSDEIINQLPSHILKLNIKETDTWILFLVAQQEKSLLGREVRTPLEMTGQDCTHHVPRQSPGTSPPEALQSMFSVVFPCWVVACCHRSGFFCLQIVAHLATKSGKVFQSTIISHSTCTTVPSTRHRRKEPARLYPCPAHAFCSVICPETSFVFQSYSC